MATTTLRGNLVADPKFTEGAKPESDRVNFTIAENRRDSEGEQLDPLYHNVVAWGQNARNIADSSQVFRKGAYVICEGLIVHRKREVFDKDGEPFNITEVSFRTNELLKGTRFATIDAVTQNEKSGSASRGKSTRSRDEDEAPARGRGRARSEAPAEDVNEGSEAPAEDAELVGAGAGARGGARGASRGAGRSAGRGRAARGSEARDW